MKWASLTGRDRAFELVAGERPEPAAEHEPEDGHSSVPGSARYLRISTRSTVTRPILHQWFGGPGRI